MLQRLSSVISPSYLNLLAIRDRCYSDGHTTEQVFHQMVNEISFLHDELTSKDTIINLLF